MLRAVQNSLLSIVYPQECNVCSSNDELVDGLSCLTCWQETRLFTGEEMLCSKCGALLGEKAAEVPVRCLKCDDYHFEKAYAAGVYEKALAAAVIRLKISPYIHRKLSHVLRKASEERIPINDIDVLIPMPLSKQRRVERGFNQAELIADELRRFTGIPVDALSLARTKHTQIHRAGMDQKGRELSVKNSFKVLRTNLVEGRRVLLVDDVLTSGATSSSCAQELKKCGASSVRVFTMSRAVLS